MTRWTGIHLTTDKVALPADAGTQKFNFLGRSGAGKTYAAGKFVEELLDVGNQVVVIDPVGVWWGLRLAANGKDPGIAIPVFGGQRGDKPLTPTAGNLMADVIVDYGQPMVLDVSEMTGGEMRRFIADFATHLLQRKKRSRTPLMVVWDECQDFVPQRVFGDAAKMVGAVERLIKQGRNFGIGTTLISQRPQAVNKDVLNQAEVLVCFQLTGPQERKTIEGWIVDKDLEKHDLLEKLPSLEIGHAFFWSPQWLQSLRRVKFLKKRTFDVSATPTLSDAKQVRDLVPIDLERIEQAMAETVERAKNNDPGHLQGIIRQLRQELTRLQQAKPLTPTKVVTKEVPVINERLLERAAVSTLKAVDAIERLNEGSGKILGQLADIHMRLASAMKATAAPPPSQAPTPPVFIKAAPPRPVVRPTMRPSAAPVGDGTVNRAALRLLQALRSRHPHPLTRVQMAALAGISSHTSTFRNYLSMCRVAEALSEDNDGRFQLTDVGMQQTENEQVPCSPEEVLALWCNKITGKAAEMLRYLFNNPGQWFTRAELAAAVGISHETSTFRNYLSMINSPNLVLKSGATISINQDIFAC
jgi:hypothetical protein